MEVRGKIEKIAVYVCMATIWLNGREYKVYGTTHAEALKILIETISFLNVWPL